LDAAAAAHRSVLHLCVKVLLPLAAVNVFCSAVYLWLTEPLPQVRLVVQIGVAIVAVLLAGGVFAIVAWAFVHRERSTFKVMSPQHKKLPTLPGA
jgi:hypothetical protein